MIANIKYKEVKRDHIGSTSYSGENLTRGFIIEFFGLNEPDVEWYEIEIK